MSATLPSGLSEGSLDAALEEFRAALGDEAVITEDAAVREFRDPFWPADDDTYAPSVVVMPETTEQVQEIVRIANSHASRCGRTRPGATTATAGPSPRVGGAVTISLRNMNRVLEINEELGYAVVEPGVRWFDLYDALQEGGHDAHARPSPISGGGASSATRSTTGSPTSLRQGLRGALRHGGRPRRRHAPAHRHRRQEGNTSWHLYKRGLGPVLDPLFIQSNYGIVTRMGYCSCAGPRCLAAVPGCGPRETVGPAIDIVRDLQLEGRSAGRAEHDRREGGGASRRPRAQSYAGGGALPDEIQERSTALGLGRWAMRAASGATGPGRRAPSRRWAGFEAIAGAKVIRAVHSRADAAEEIARAEKMLAGIPNLEVNAMTGWYGGEEGGHIGFSPVIPLAGDSFVEVYDCCAASSRRRPAWTSSRAASSSTTAACVMVAMLLFDTKDAEQTRRAYDVAKRLAVEAGKRGYGEYRAHLDFMDLTADQYGFNDHAYRRFCERIKDAVDPNGILSPGRHGIWPAGMRDGR